jgi:hypothetical protein
MFFLAQGRVLRRLGRFEEAMRLLTHIIKMPNTPSELHREAFAERMLTAALMTQSADDGLAAPTPPVLSSPLAPAPEPAP